MSRASWTAWTITSQYGMLSRSLLITEAHKHKSPVVPTGTTDPLTGEPSHYSTWPQYTAFSS